MKIYIHETGICTCTCRAIVEYLCFMNVDGYNLDSCEKYLLCRKITQNLWILTAVISTNKSPSKRVL